MIFLNDPFSYKNKFVERRIENIAPSVRKTTIRFHWVKNNGYFFLLKTKATRTRDERLAVHNIL